MVVAFPEPSVFDDVPRWLPFVVAPAYVVVALAFGSWWIHIRTINDLRWAIEGRAPTRADQRNAFMTPWRIACPTLVFWGAGHALLDQRSTACTTPTSFRGMAPRCRVLRRGGGHQLRTCSPSSRCGRWPPQALAAGPPPRRLAPGIMGRTMTVWMLGSGVPMIGIGLIALFSLLLRNLTQRQLEVAILITSAVSLVVGFLLMWILAWLTATPVRVVRAALQRVEEGDLDASLVVFDGTELGELQRGFNSMVAGLREREQVRDLFGRHVGREVAAAAEQQRPTLGGEERHVAVVFVDVVGSTKLVSTRPPKEVVDLLNRFFAVIVEEVDRHHGHGQQVRGRRRAGDLRRAGDPGQPEDDALAAARAIVATTGA